jgi:hypothetical protein
MDAKERCLIACLVSATALPGCAPVDAGVEPVVHGRDAGVDVAVPVEAGGTDAGADSSDSSTTHDARPSVSQNCATLKGKTGEILDASGNVWTLVTGGDGSLVVDENGAAAGYSDQVVRLVYVDAVVSQENSSGGWYSWGHGTWTAAADPTGPCQPKSEAGAGGTAITSRGPGVQYKGFGYGSFSELSGTDGPFSAPTSTTGTSSWFEQPAAIDQINAQAILGANAIDVQLEWAYYGQGDSNAPEVYGATETRAGYSAVVAAAANAGLDVWTKFQIFAQSGDNRVLFVPSDPAQFFTNLKTMVFGAVDAAEAALAPLGKHMWGIVLTSEMNALAQPSFDSYWQSIYTAAHARYPHLRFVTNMTEGPLVLTAVSDTYLRLFDVISTDLYTPIGDGVNLPTYSEVKSRLNTTAYGGSGNWFGTQPPPNASFPYDFSTGIENTLTHNGLAGVSGSVMGFLKGFSESAGKQVLIGEDGFASAPGTSVSPSTASGGTLSQAGMDESIVDWRGILDAFYDPAQASWYAGTMWWSWGPYDDATAFITWASPGTSWDINQKQAILGYFASRFGGSVPPLSGGAQYLPWSNDDPSWNE